MKTKQPIQIFFFKEILQKRMGGAYIPPSASEDLWRRSCLSYFFEYLHQQE